MRPRSDAIRRPARKSLAEAFASFCPLALLIGALALALSARAAAEWMQPDPSLREAQFELRMAARDTAGHAHEPGRLDTLGLALLKLGRLDEAASIFARSLALAPGDDAAEAGLGKIALFNDRLAAAESLLAGVPNDPEAIRDRFAGCLRRQDWAGAIELAEDASETGRVPLLEALGDGPAYDVTAGPAEATVFWTRAYPVPLVRVKLNGNSVLMALDTGTADLLIDDSAARRNKVTSLGGQRLEFWMGTRVAVKNAMVQRLEIGGYKVERIPAGTLSLRKWTIEINPRSEAVVGIIGLNFLRRFRPTFDYPAQRLVLRRGETPFTPDAGAQSVPFHVWGHAELTVRGAISGSRPMTFVVQSGVPGCGIGAPQEVFDEVGMKAGAISRLVKGAGSWLSGRPWAEVTASAVSVGPVVRDRVPGWSGALDSGELWRHGVRRDALVSHDFFRRSRVTYDWAARKLVFEE